MKKRLRVFCAAWGLLDWFLAKSLDNVIGCLFFALGIILLVGSCIAETRNEKKDKEDK